MKNCSEKWDIGEEGDSRRNALSQFASIVSDLEINQEAIRKLEEDNFKSREKEVVKETIEKFHLSPFDHKNKNEPYYYHPGLLRFFSCRGCGGDEYYNCCQKCKK